MIGSKTPISSIVEPVSFNMGIVDLISQSWEFRTMTVNILIDTVWFLHIISNFPKKLCTKSSIIVHWWIFSLPLSTTYSKF